jgi:hypothetical protein
LEILQVNLEKRDHTILERSMHRLGLGVIESETHPSAGQSLNPITQKGEGVRKMTMMLS